MYKLAIVMVLLVSGCASNTSFPNVTYGRDIEKKYPPVSVVLNDGYVVSSSLCTQYGCETFIDQSGLILLAALRNTSMFEQVDMNNAYSEYRLDIKFNENLQGSKAAEFSKAMLGAATLLLVPKVSDMETSFSVSVFHKNQVVKEYAYKTQYSRTASLFSDAQDARKNRLSTSWIC